MSNVRVDATMEVRLILSAPIGKLVVARTDGAQFGMDTDKPKDVGCGSFGTL